MFILCFSMCSWFLVFNHGFESVLELQLYLKVYYSCLDNLEACGNIAIVNENEASVDNITENGIAWNTILNLWGLGAFSKGNYQTLATLKLNFVAIMII